MLISQKELHKYKRNTPETTHAYFVYLFIYLTSPNTYLHHNEHKPAFSAQEKQRVIRSSLFSDSE